MEPGELKALKSMEKYRQTLPPLFWGYEVRAFPKEYFDKDYIPVFKVDRLKTKKEQGRGFYKPISKF